VARRMWRGKVRTRCFGVRLSRRIALGWRNRPLWRVGVRQSRRCWWRHVRWWRRGILRGCSGPFTEGSVVMLVELFSRERSRSIGVVTALIACCGRDMSEDTRSIGSTEAVSGKHGRRCWGFTLAFSRSFSGSFSGSLSLAFSGAFAFTSTLADGGFRLTGDKLGCSVGGFSACAILIGSAGRAEGVDLGLDLALHPRSRDGCGCFHAGFGERVDDRFARLIEAGAHGRAARAILAGGSDVLRWRIQCIRGPLRMDCGDVARRISGR